MDIADLQKIAERSRSRREIGIALIVASCVLGIFIILSPAPQESSVPIAVATSTAPDAFANVQIEAKAAVVYDLSTDKILYAKNADAQLPLASLTKLLTVYSALNELSPNTPITIPSSVTNIDAPRAFSAGQTFSLFDLARLTLTGSLNDGASAIAIATAARENRSQSEMLAATAQALNMTQTYAINGSGLDVNTAISGGYGSARDLSHLAGALVAKAPTIADATTQNSVEALSSGGTVISVKNTDPMVTAIPRLLLSKTGYTDLAGGNLALVFDSGINHPVAVIVLGSSENARFTDGMALVDATLAHFAGVASL
jgi:D-alanyl-D-alanine carboxypeptidase